MNQDWITQKKETRRTFSRSTWVPLRAIRNESHGNIQKVGYVNEFFGCGSVAFLPEYREIAEQLSWQDIGICLSTNPYAYEDGYYSPIDQYQYNDKQPIGLHLIFEQNQPVIGRRLWILNPDIIVALHLIKEGTNWVRPEENFVIVAREVFDEKGNHCLIEIKREFLLDYLAARNLSLRLSYYRQRVENVVSLEGSIYSNLSNKEEQRDGGRFQILIRRLEDIYGGSWASLRVWRTDIDEDDDNPIMEPENDDNTDSESSEGYRHGFEGTRVEGEFWRDEWIDHQGQSMRIRGDEDNSLPQFIVETDGTRISSSELKNEDIGRWLWFHSSVINELLGFRGFSLGWYTAETGYIKSTSGYTTHFGINSMDLITVYAYDIACLNVWEQHIWFAHNVVPEGKVSFELLASQVKSQQVSTKAAEVLLFKCMRIIEESFKHEYNIALFTHDIDDTSTMQNISRFVSKDLKSLLRLAKELVRVFSDRLNVRELRKISVNPEKEKLGSNKLLQDILTEKTGSDKARLVFAAIVGTYDMRIGDAHPTSSKIEDALKLAGIDWNKSFQRQGEQLISNFGQSIWYIWKLLFEPKK
ncbi:hypothetical protein LEP1GSC195_1642 [Leptospira wolbachii serovar Codice str. CDC]|uniref:Uncharacterized protein n=1 Tax=Leptospira wolbachii serovar Codice str. CDC TaxID=1218599 RepID=R9A4Y3_9LEPT|nr:hypothetical protein [Leptospira wolbachii]EOQ97251.1 hypothetical protein LEP1GSC195_1642 [Leptospira wolbachii serovar Codice str. CDC]